MKIAIISDTHDNKEVLEGFIEFLNGKLKPEVLIHCGDFCAPFMIKELSKFNGEVHCVFGNTDDRFTSTSFAIENGINLHGDLAELEIGGKKIAVIHNNQLGYLLAKSGEFDVVFHGHNHEQKKEKVGDTLLVNPGCMVSYKQSSQYAIYDTDTNEVELKKLFEDLWGKVKLIIKKKGTVSADHSHELPEVLYLVEGDIELTVGDNVKKISAPVKMNFKSGEYHKIVALTDIKLIEEKNV